MQETSQSQNRLINQFNELEKSTATRLSIFPSLQKKSSSRYK